MRRIAQKGVRAPQVNKAAKEAKASMLKKYQTGGRKKAQGGGKFEDYNEKNRYAGGPGFASKMLSGAYENQEWVKAKRADDLRKSKMTQEQRDNEKAYYQRRAEMAKQDQAAKDKMNQMRGGGGDQQRRGGKTVKRVKKAQTGTKYTSSKADQKEIEERQRYLDRIINTNRPDTLTARSRYVPGITERQERNQILLDRTKKVEADMKARGIGNRRNGGASKKKAQTGARTKAKYGAAKKSSSKRYK